jgi:HEAT repeat protein
MVPRQWVLFLPVLFGALPAGADEIADLAAALGGGDAVAERRACQRLPGMGEPAVAELARTARAGESLPARLMAVELLGRIGSPAAASALIEQLRIEKDLSLRNQICIQLGRLRDERAVPVLAEWLRTIGPRAIDDVPGPKEAQPSTCYLRHVEALAQIGDERAVPALETFARNIPKGVGYGGFISNFLNEATKEAILEIREKAAFEAAVRRAGIADALPPLLTWMRTDSVARYRMHEDQLIRRTAQGRAIVEQLTKHDDPAVASAAKAVLGKWETLKQEGAGQ